MYWSMISFLTSSSSLTPTSLRVEPTTFRVWVKESQLIIGQKTEATKLDLVAWSPSSPCQLGHHHLDQSNLDHHCHQYRHCCHHCWHQVKNLIWIDFCRMSATIFFILVFWLFCGVHVFHEKQWSFIHDMGRLWRYMGSRKNDLICS